MWVESDERQNLVWVMSWREMGLELRTAHEVDLLSPVEIYT